MSTKRFSGIAFALLLVGCAGAQSAVEKQQAAPKAAVNYAINILECTDRVTILEAGLGINFWLTEFEMTPGNVATFRCWVSRERIPNSFFKEQGARLLEVAFCKKEQDCVFMSKKTWDVK